MPKKTEKQETPVKAVVQAPPQQMPRTGLADIFSRYEIGMNDPECKAEVRALWLNSEDATPLDFRKKTVGPFELAMLGVELWLDDKHVEMVFHLNKHTKTCFTYSVEDTDQVGVHYQSTFDTRPELRATCEVTPDGILYRIVKFEKLEMRTKA